MDTLRDCRPTYIRLSGCRTEERHRRERGIFCSAGRLDDARATTYADEARLRAILGWLNRNLPYPKKLDRVDAIFWFKGYLVAPGTEFWGKMEELKELLNRYEYEIEMRQTQRPGYIVYEDNYQIAAVPFRDTFAIPE